MRFVVMCLIGLACAGAADAAVPRPLYDPARFEAAAPLVPVTVEPLEARTPAAVRPAPPASVRSEAPRPPAFDRIALVPVRADAFAQAFRIITIAALALLLVLTLGWLARTWVALSRPLQV